MSLCPSRVPLLHVGCVERSNSSEDWLVKNFGAFRAMARMKDFSSLNMVFSGVSFSFLWFCVCKMPMIAGSCVSTIPRIVNMATKTGDGNQNYS